MNSEQVLSATAAELMSPHFVCVEVGSSLTELLAELGRADAGAFSYYVYLVDAGALAGVISLREALMLEESDSVEGRRLEAVVGPDTPGAEVARLLSRYDMLAIPVVTPDQAIVGIVTADDALAYVSHEPALTGEPSSVTGGGRLFAVALMLLCFEIAITVISVRAIPARLGRGVLAFLPLVLIVSSSGATAAAGVTLRIGREAWHRSLRELEGAVISGILGSALCAAIASLIRAPQPTVRVVAAATGLSIVVGNLVGAAISRAWNAKALTPLLALATSFAGDVVGLACFAAAATFLSP